MDATDFKRASGATVRAVKTAAAAIRRNPALALLTSLAAGFMVGLILRRPPHEGEPK